MKEIPNNELIIISYLNGTNDLIYFNNSINIRNYIKYVINRNISYYHIYLPKKEENIFFQLNKIKYTKNIFIFKKSFYY